MTSSLVEELGSLKDLTDQLCASSQCSPKGALGQHCAELRETLESLIDAERLCIDDVYVQVSSVISKITKAVAAEPSTNTFALSILLERYGTWVKTIKQNQIAISNMGSNAKPLSKEQLNVDFASLSGSENEKLALREGLILPFMFPRLFVRPKGVLMYGPAGTGKTMLAKALVKEVLNCAFFAPDPASLKGKYEGETEARITAVYSAATALLDAPPKYRKGKKLPQPTFAIIFVDEIDALLGAGRDEDASKQRTVNTFLQLMDGIKSDSRIITVGATNLPFTLDTAVLRRLNLSVFVDLPTKEARESIIRTAIDKRYALPGSKSSPMELIAEYGKVSRQRGYVSTTDKLEALTEEQVLELVRVTGPSDKAESYMKQRDANDFSSKALRELGFSPSELTTALSAAFNSAAGRAATRLATYKQLRVKYQGKEQTYYVYNPNGDLDVNDLDTDEYRVNYQIREEHGDMIVSFDISMEDIIDALKAAPRSLSVPEYKQLLEWQSGGA